MKYIESIREGDRLNDIYFCKNKQSLVTKNGKPYESVLLQDKTGVIDAKIWEPNSMGIDEFDTMDYVEVGGEVTSFQGQLQVSIKRIRKCAEGEYDPANYLPVSDKNTEDMWSELMECFKQISNPYLKKLLYVIFMNPAFKERFLGASAAKSIHHGFIGGLMEHTLGVVRLCRYYCANYPFLNRDLLITAAACHDIGKLQELSPFPQNDYTDDGQLLGHIVMGAQMVHDAIREIEGFPHTLESELVHCILSHHGELEYGSPKKPAMAEAVALSLADNADAKLETMREALGAAKGKDTWIGYNKLFETNLRKTEES